MEGASNTTNVPDDSVHTRIAGSYPEHTETIPLKATATREPCGGSLRVIVICFFILTLAITIALAAQIHLGDYQLVPHGSVATDSRECSNIGTDIMKMGGNSVDAAIASTLCMGVVNPHITGIGGGGFLIIYDHRKRHVLDVIDFREVSAAVVADGEDAGIDVGVPGLISGLSLAHQLHGLLTWEEVVMPAVQLARSGFKVPANLVSARSKLQVTTGAGNARLQEFMANLEAGTTLLLPRLAATLELIAMKGADVLYNGSLADQIIKTVSEAGGSMTLQDLRDYQPIRQRALIGTFRDFQVVVPDAPSGGPLLLAMLTLLNNTQDITDPVQTITVLEQIIEAHRADWGEPGADADQTNSTVAWSFPDSVGSHVAAIDSDDLYVSIVSGLNMLFGSQLLTDNEFILNNALVNFGSANNAEGPSKRPLSLATPVIAVQATSICGRRFVLGAGDFSVVGQVLAQLVAKYNISNSVEAPRIRLTNLPMTFGYEYWHGSKLSNATIDRLVGLNYKLQQLTEPYQSCNLVEKLIDDLTSHSDSRGQGIASRF